MDELPVIFANAGMLGHAGNVAAGASGTTLTGMLPSGCCSCCLSFSTCCETATLWAVSQSACCSLSLSRSLALLSINCWIKMFGGIAEAKGDNGGSSC